MNIKLAEMNIGLIYSKFFKKYIRWKSISGTVCDKTSRIGSGCTVYNCVVGRYSYIGYDCEIINTTIGSFCSFSSGIHIGLAEHPIEWISTSPVFQDVKNSSIKKRFARLQIKPTRKTVIKNDVWVGTNAIIKAGVHIGNGAVIASGAVVTKDVEPYAIVGGCPAKLIRYRFDDYMREKFLNSRWWELDDETLSQVGKYANNPEKFLQYLRKI